MVTIISSKAKNADLVAWLTAAAHLPKAGWICTYNNIAAVWRRSKAHLTRPERDAASDEMENASRWSPARQDELEHALEEWDNEGGNLPLAPHFPAARIPATMLVGHPKYYNDIGAREIRIGVTEFHCIGALPPQDHPHVYLNMEGKPHILCPYCSTRYIYDERLQPDETEPANCFYSLEVDELVNPHYGRSS